LFWHQRFYPSGLRDSTISLDCVIGYVATIQNLNVPNERQTSALKQVAIFCDGSSLGNGKGRESRGGGRRCSGIQGILARSRLSTEARDDETPQAG
jgi:hypothetical protein